MIRFQVLSIVLALGVGSHAALPCRAWCEPLAVAMSGCHEEDAAAMPSVTEGTCDHVVLHMTALLQDAVRRAPVPDVGDAVVFAPQHRTPPAVQDLAWHGPGWETAIDRQPVSTALRI